MALKRKSTLLLSGPLIMVVGWLVFFWAARGVKGLVYVLKYKPALAGAPAPATA